MEAAPAASPAAKKPFSWRAVIVWVVGGLAAIYLFAFVDLTFRARSAYLEGEKYLAWHRDPSLKKAHYDAACVEAEAALRRELEAGKLSKLEFEQKLDLARFERDQRISESSLKYAYVWFQSAVELFSPPESRWVKLSRGKMAESKELWKQELRAQKIPFEDYMLE